MKRSEPRPSRGGGGSTVPELHNTSNGQIGFHRSKPIRGPPSPRDAGQSSSKNVKQNQKIAKEVKQLQQGQGPSADSNMIPLQTVGPGPSSSNRHGPGPPTTLVPSPSQSKKQTPGKSQNSTNQNTAGSSIAPASGQVISPANQTLYLQKIRESSEAVNSGDFRRAVQLYSEAIALDPSNHILFTNRSAAYAKLHQYNKSLEDAREAKLLNPKWAKAYLREGVALQQLGQHGEALAAFASGLSQDSNNASLLSGLIDAALKSPLKDKLAPTFSQLQKLKLNQSPFVIISVIGQELLGAGHYSAAVTMLEAALNIGTCSLKLRGSVFSALSSAHWGLGNIDSAITYMQHDLSVAKSLGDHEGECRAHGNLGSAYFSKGHYKEALSNHRYQLALAMKLKQRPAAASALGSLGHVYTAIGDYPNALQSHKQCLFLMKQGGDKLSEAREIGNAGAVYLAMGDFASAVECHNKHLEMAKSLKNNVEEARAYSNLGSAYHYKRDYEKAISYHKQVLKVAEEKTDKTLEARAYAGLGHAARCMQDYGSAKTYHEKQLDNALQTKDKVAEGRACSNLGIIFHQLGDYKSALKLHEVHLKIAKDLGDRASQGRAYGNMGNAHSALGQYDQAVKYHKQELVISSQVNDRHSESATHGNLAVAYQCLGMYEKSLNHYMTHLNISRELKDSASEARALCNLGNYHSSRADYSSAVTFYEQYLMLSQELHDSEGEAKACFNLGYAHFSLGNHLEAVRYYEQDMAIARELKDQMGMARAYCNLGLAHKALSNFDDALECQTKCLNMMKTMKNTKGIFRAMGNIGDLMLKMGKTDEAIQMYQEQLQLAKQGKNKDLLATAYGALGAAHRVMGQYDKALGYHTQELSIRQDMEDLKGECRAHGNLGNVHMSLANYMNAYKCYEEQLEKSRELGDSALEAQACGNLGITKLNMSNFEDAIGLFEQQLAMLEQVNTSTGLFEKGRALGNLGDCYEALGDFDESIRCHEQYLAIAQQANSLPDQDKSYRGLGNAHRAVGNLQQALVCFEKRLVVAHELNSASAKASAYGELGCLHSLLGNFEQAISCLQHQLQIAQEMGDRACEGEAACGLGGVYQNMGDYDKALEYHKMDLKIAEETLNTVCQCRAYGNLGLSHESLGNYKEAIQFQEQHLSIAAQMNDRVAKTLAYSSLGRVHHALNNHTQAVEYLKQGLTIAEQLGRREDEAKIRHRLGLSLWGKGDLEECQAQLHKAADLFEGIRRDAQFNSEYKMSLFDLQTACYQALQRVLVSMNRHDEALVIAERACTRAFIDYLLERQAGTQGLYHGTVDPPPITSDQIIEIVSHQRSLVLCFSIAAGYLYSWLVTPHSGIVKFHETNMSELETDYTDQADTLSLKSVNFGSCSLLDQYVGHVRESMGIENHTAKSASMGSVKHIGSETDSETDDVWQQHLEELGDKLNAENDRTGFLRMVNRNHKMNSSSYSLSSMFSFSASLNGVNMNGVTSSFNAHRKNSLRIKQAVASKAPLGVLYQLLIAPFEEAIEAVSSELEGGVSDLVLVLQGELYLIPFPVLRKEQNDQYLFERFNLIVMPSITALQNGPRHDKHGRPVIDSSGAVIVGNPKLSPTISQNWYLKEIPGAEYEARIVGELLTSRPLIGAEATKAAVLQQIEQVEVIHFATHLSWKLSSIVLSPGDNMATQHRFPSIDSDDSSSDMGGFDGPSLAEYLLTAADILNLKLHAKLVVLSSGYTDDRAGRINSDGVVGLTRALLSAGAQCVLYSLWPVPDQAAKLLMRNMYTSLQEGQCVTHALSYAIKTVQCTKQFSHPANWGGWILVGHDVKLSSKVALMGHAICEMLQSPNHCREAMRVLLHLIEKSLQRIHQGIKNSMYTTYQSIDNKVGGIPGWKDLLQAVGFRFESAGNGLPPAVFFPQTDPGDRLTQASASLQALLGLPPSSLSAMSKFLPNYDVGEANIRVLRDILSKMAAKEASIDVEICVKLWRGPGCHEFLASLGLDLVEVGRDDVTLRLGKQANRRQLQFALQSLVAVFDTQEAPKSLSLDSSSSLESLSSSHSGSTSTSNFSKGSTPPLSPRGSRKKSLFNPAEMEKMRMMNRMQLMNQGGLSGRKVRSRASRSNGQSDPSIYLSHQSRIRNMYGPTGTTIAHQSDMNELQEISENSESETDRQSSGKGSWRECRMTVSTNSESDTSTIPEGTEGDVLQSSTELYQLSGMSLEFKDREQYSLASPPPLRQQSPANGERNDITNGDFQVSSWNGVLGEDLKTEFRREDMKRHSNSSQFSEGDYHQFERRDTLRNSNTSNISSIDEGTCVMDSKRSSLSDSSHGGEGYGERESYRHSNDLPLPESTFYKSDLQMSGQFSSESGINSEVTSSNQSDASQQSVDLSGIQLTHQELALKVLADVGNKREILESAQRQNLVQTQQASQVMRQQFNSSLPNKSPLMRPFQGSGGGFQPPVKVPPPIPQKPKLNRPMGPMNATGPMDNQNISTSASSKSDSRNGNVVPIATGRNYSVITGPQSSRQYPAPIGSSTLYTSLSGAPPTSTSPSFSTFHPRGQQMISRPDSTTSVSSYCSTGSSVLSVIHRPPVSKGSAPVEDQGRGVNIGYQNMPNITPPSYNTAIPYPPSTADGLQHHPSAKPGVSSARIDNTQESDKTTSLNGKPPTGSTRGTSPKSILNNSPSCLRSNSKGKKPQKRVSFSDSEPSDLESPSTHGPNNRISPVNSAISNQKPEDFLSPLQRLNNVINKPSYPGYQPGCHGNETAPVSSYYMNGSVKSDVTMSSNASRQLTQNSTIVGPTHSLGGSSVNGPILTSGPNSTSSDQIRMLYSGQRTHTKSQVLQSSKC